MQKAINILRSKWSRNQKRYKNVLYFDTDIWWKIEVKQNNRPDLSWVVVSTWLLICIKFSHLVVFHIGYLDSVEWQREGNIMRVLEKLQSPLVIFPEEWPIEDITIYTFSIWLKEFLAVGLHNLCPVWRFLLDSKTIGQGEICITLTGFIWHAPSWVTASRALVKTGIFTGIRDTWPMAAVNKASFDSGLPLKT